MNNSYKDSESPLCGVIYLAFGGVFAAKALYSAETVRRSNPDVGICIVSNIEFPGEENLAFWQPKKDVWVYLDMPSSENRHVKTRIVEYSPFKKNMYIDCDTFVTGSLDLAWFFLDYFDLCLRIQDDKQKHKHVAEYEVFPGVAVFDLPHWNSGTMLFKTNDASMGFFRTWNHNFNQSDLAFDQPSLVKTLFESDIKILSLNSYWNGGFKPLDRGKKRGIPLVVHYHSAYDARIEERLRKYHAVLVATGGAVAGEISSYISNRNRMHAREEKAKFFLRRAYRRWWYKKYLS